MDRPKGVDLADIVRSFRFDKRANGLVPRRGIATSSPQRSGVGYRPRRGYPQVGGDGEAVQPEK